MNWNYRIVKKRYDNNQDDHQVWFEVVEAFYDEDGVINGWTDTTDQPLRIVGDTAEELIEVYETILKDLKKSKDWRNFIIDDDKFEGERDDKWGCP